MVMVHVLGETLSGWFFGTTPQVPLAPSAHDMQTGQLATPQQTPSTHVPVAHSEVRAQTCPLAFLQVPDPSHVLAPLQVFGMTLSGVPAGMLLQVPPTPSAHDLQTGQLATPQQTPSTHVPVAHSEVRTQA